MGSFYFKDSLASNHPREFLGTGLRVPGKASVLFVNFCLAAGVLQLEYAEILMQPTDILTSHHYYID